MCKTEKTTVIQSRVRLLAAMKTVQHNFSKTSPIVRDPTKESYFCTDEYGERIIRKALDFSQVIQWVQNNENHHYLGDSIDLPGLHVSYAQSKKHKYDTAKRTRTTLGRYLRRTCQYFLEKENWYKREQGVGYVSILDSFCDAVTAQLVDPTEMISIVSGRELYQAYEDSFGDSSCMSGDDAHFTELYAQNPDKVQMLKFDNGNIQARCLLWNAQKHGDKKPVKCLDRIYPNSGAHINVIQEFMKKQGYICRSHNSMPDGDQFPIGLFVELDASGLEYIPYMDSFRYTDDGYMFSTIRGDFVCDETDGSNPFYGEGCEECYGCGCHLGRSDFEHGEARHSDDGDSYCDSCYCDRFGSCERCSEETQHEDLVEVAGGRWGVEHWCSYCADNNAHQCSCCDSISVDPTQETTSGRELCADCLESENVQDCHTCGELHEDGEGLTHTDDGVFCDGCLPEPVEA